MKIKTKKVVTEKEHLHYIIDKTDFLSISRDFTHVDHDIIHSDIVLELHDHNNVTCANTWVDSEGETVFEVEIEEEITEDTVIPKLVERWKHDGEGDEAFRYVEYDDKSINTVLFANPESVETTHFYIENDNQELVLIWRDGKLI